MIFCTNNIMPSSATSESGTLTRFPYSNLFTDSLQDKYFFTSLTISLSGKTGADVKKIILAGFDGAATVAVSVNSGAYSYTMSITDGIGVVDSTVPDATAITSISFTASLSSVGHIYVGNPYTLPDPSFGSLPNYQSNDFISEAQTGKYFRTEGHVTRQESFSVIDASKSEWEAFTAAFSAEDRRKPFMFFQTEGNTSLFPPFFARLDGDPNFSGRGTNNTFNWDFNIREVF